MNKTGLIVKGIGGFYYIKTEENEIIECRARGVFRKEGIKPLVGDFVEITDETGGFYLSRIMPRKNQLIRPAVANLDQCVIVVAADFPKPDTVLIDKITVALEIRGITPVICINKADIADTSRLQKIYGKTGYKVLVTCAVSSEGIDELKSELKGKLSAFAGNSGVGKSSIMNSIMPRDVMETGEISKIERGRHTTRHSELMEIDNGGLVIDTPGFGSFDIDVIESEELKCYFPEFRQFEGQCRFSGCNHVSEPGCAVLSAVKEKIVSKSRHKSYLNLFEDLKAVKKY